jgi:uncharacterized membrane protein
MSFTLFPLFSALGAEHAASAARTLEERGISPLLISGLISTVPIFELRGGIPVGIALFELNPFLVYPVAVCFNLVPVLPVLLLLNPIRRLLENRPVFRSFFVAVDKKAGKNRNLMHKYKEVGLMLFVAVPLPVTGAWTGSLVSAVMGLRPLKSFFFIACGVGIAGVIVTLLTVLKKTGALIAVLFFASFCAVYIAKYLRDRKRLGKMNS